MASHVLHRFLVPRHPPCALKNLAYRCSRPLCSSQTTTRHPPTPTPDEAMSVGPAPRQRPYGRSLRTQQRARHPHHPPRSTPRRTVLTAFNRVCRIVNVPPMSDRARHLLASGHVLLRKEVIQPHLPVRLPCYDFVPIAGPTFDGSSPYGLGHRLRVLPTFVT